MPLNKGIFFFFFFCIFRTHLGHMEVSRLGVKTWNCICNLSHRLMATPDP